jgi:hypothetical protein
MVFTVAVTQMAFTWEISEILEEDFLSLLEVVDRMNSGMLNIILILLIIVVQTETEA